MTVIVNIGRRIPKNWFKRTAGKLGGLISFQQNIWMMIDQSLNQAKKKANSSGLGILFIKEKDRESEDIRFDIEWIKIRIQGTKTQEEDEYKDSLKMYSSLGQVMKKELPKDESLSKHFKTKVLTSEKVQEAYKRGYGAMEDNNMANKLLEMGILTHVEWVDDFNEREPVIEPGMRIN